MLELALIKTTPKSAEAPSNGARKPVDREAKEEPRQDFDDEYEATADRKRETPNEAGKTAEKPGAARKSEQPDKAKGPEEATETTEAGAGDETRGLATDEIPEEEVLSDEAPSDEIRFDADIGMSEKGLPGEAHQQKALSAPLVDMPKRPLGEAPEVASETADADTETVTGSARAEPQPTKKTPQRSSTAETIVMSKALENAGRAVPPAQETGEPEEVRSGKSQPREVALEAVKDGSVAAQVIASSAPKVALTEKPQTEKPGKPLPREMKLLSAEIQMPQPAAAPAPVRQPVIAPAQALLKLEALKEKAASQVAAIGEIEGLAPFETRTTTQTSSVSTAHFVHRAETASMIGRQMAEALRNMPDRPVEISLNPRELGRVRMNISAVEAGIP